VSASERENVVAVVADEQIGQLGGAHLHIVDRILEQAVAIVGDLVLRGGVDAGSRRYLHQTHGVSARNNLLVEVALLAGDRISDRGLDRRGKRVVVGQGYGRVGGIL